jgi:hypothetical protein
VDAGFDAANVVVSNLSALPERPRCHQVVADDLLSVLSRFHREVVMPDVRQAIGDAVSGSEGRLSNEMLSGFDAMHKRLDRLENEDRLFMAAVRRIE